MKIILSATILCVSMLSSLASSLSDRIQVEAMVVTKAELRRHMAADVNDQLQPSSYSELFASQGDSQPDYLVVRFHELIPGHYFGEAEAQVNEGPRGIKLNVVLHFNKGWVEYFIPLDGYIYGMPGKQGAPVVTVKWNSITSK